MNKYNANETTFTSKTERILTYGMMTRQSWGVTSASKKGRRHVWNGSKRVVNFPW